MSENDANYRIEHDSLGEVRVPKEAYYGGQTKRAMNLYDISHVSVGSFEHFVYSFAYIKKAAAITNHNLELISDEALKGITYACDELLAGKYHEHIVVDAIQGGAGTSTNMNFNEVIANIGLEHLGYSRGDYQHLHPNDDVNLSQSTNDVYPTALRMALYLMLEELLDSMGVLISILANKRDEFSGVIKIGRTQLQEAVPITLGMEFGAWSSTLLEDVTRVREAAKLLLEVNLGGTAVGTRINSHPKYTAKVIKKLSDLSGLPMKTSANLVEATQDTGAYIYLSGTLKRLAVKLSKICNDLRLMSSGPRAGFNEINLPPMTPGSSIMPGKVNPVIPEVVNQVCFQVVGFDTTVTMASEAGQLELNVMEPIIAYSLFTGIKGMQGACSTLAHNCITDITANEKVCYDGVYNSIGIATLLNPHIGYEKASIIAKESLATGRSVIDIVVDKGIMTMEEIDALLVPENLASPTMTKRKIFGIL